MKKESEFNTVVKKSLDLKGFGHKISDVGQIEHGKLPFDGFGCFNDKMVVWESKFLSSPQALNLNRLEEHQIYNLLKVYNSFEDKERVCSLFLVGVVFGRNDIRCFYWKNEDLFILNYRKENKNNILKKEFESIDNFLPIKKGIVDFSEII